MTDLDNLPVDGFPRQDDTLAGGAPAEPAAPPVQPAAPAKKGFSAFAIPALVMLFMMLFIFGLEFFLSTRKVNLVNLYSSQSVGFANYDRFVGSGDFGLSLWNSLRFRGLQLVSAGVLACGLSALYYAMRKPRTLLTFACLWLIPACLPFLSTSLLSYTTYRADNSGTLAYFLTSILQTTSLFCFFGGLFAFLNLQKKGRAGGGPFYGLLVGVLAFLLSSLTAGASIWSLVPGIGRQGGTTVDALIARIATQNNNFGAAAAAGVSKVLIGIVLAIIPMVVLSILARRKSTRGKMTLTTLWVFLAIPFAAVLSFLGLSSLKASHLNSTLTSLVTVIIGGSFGGLIAYSFIHLLRRVPAFLFGLIAVILAASLSCFSAQYTFMRTLGLVNTVWPQALLSAFDWRLVLFVTVLAFALRNYQEAKPGSLVIALALLSAAFLWGEANVASMYNYREAMPISLYALRLHANVSAATEIASESTESVSNMAVVRSIQTGAKLLVALPPLFLGAGAALMLRRALVVKE